MNPDNTSSFLELLRSELPPELAAAHVFDVDDPQFNARFACQKREYWYYVPYRALFTRLEQEKMKLLWSNAGALPGPDALASWIWVSGLPTEATTEDLAWTKFSKTHGLPGQRIQCDTDFSLNNKEHIVGFI